MYDRQTSADCGGALGGSSSDHKPRSRTSVASALYGATAPGASSTNGSLLCRGNIGHGDHQEKAGD
jgi:hypothetical protein